MKHDPPPAPPQASAPVRRRRIPAFHAVPVDKRVDGWTPRRQADFIGWLAQTRSVARAARAIGMGRESAYRLRKRPGAAGFAAAWDAALGKPHRAVDLASAKATGLGAEYRWRAGLIQVRMERGRYLVSYRKDDTNAMIERLAYCNRGGRKLPGLGENSQRIEPGKRHPDVSGGG